MPRILCMGSGVYPMFSENFRDIASVIYDLSSQSIGLLSNSVNDPSYLRTSFPVIPFRDPSSLISQIIKNKIDVVITEDVFAEKLLSLCGLSDSFPPVIVLLEHSDETRTERLLRSGAHTILIKPFTSTSLELIVSNAIKYSDLNQFQRNYTRILRDTVEEQTQELMKGRDFLQGILNSSTLVSVVFTDLDQNVRFWNKGAENIFGYSEAEMLGSKITKLYPKDTQTNETVQNLQNGVKQELSTVHGKMKQLAKDGRELTISLAVSPMIGPDGSVHGMLGIGQDITEEARLHDQLLESLDMLRKIQDVTIFTLAKLAESRDEETGLHLARIQHYCRILCAELSERKEYREVLTAGFIEDLIRSSVLHDVGKVSVPDEILLSPNRFTEHEYEIMKKHPVHGGKALEEAVAVLGSDSFLSTGRDIAYFHHEHWDGSGYPFGLQGENIPLSARIVALADVYDALTTSRRYKKAYSHQEALNLILSEKGRQFDPNLVDAFVQRESEFQTVRRSLQQG